MGDKIRTFVEQLDDASRILDGGQEFGNAIMRLFAAAEQLKDTNDE